MSPALAGRFFTTSATWEAPVKWLTSANSPEVIHLRISHRTECSEVNLWTWIITYKLFALFCSHSLYLNLTVYLLFLSPLFPLFYFSPFLSYMIETKERLKKKKKTRITFLLCNLNSHSEYGGATTQVPACHLANCIISYLDLPFASISSFLYSFASVSSDLWSQIIFTYLLWIF